VHDDTSEPVFKTAQNVRRRRPVRQPVLISERPTAFAQVRGILPDVVDFESAKHSRPPLRLTTRILPSDGVTDLEWITDNGLTAAHNSARKPFCRI